MATSDHLGEQFGYLVHRVGGETHVIAHQGDKPMGALSITPDDDGDAQQRRLNKWDEPHRAITELGGQRRWTDGNMDPRDPARVSWASARNPIVLRNMMGIAIHETRKAPVADHDLSPEGSRLSKAMAKRYGIQGHPLNPDMEPTFPSYGEHEEVHKYMEGPKLANARNAQKAKEQYGSPSGADNGDDSFDPHVGVYGTVREVPHEEAEAQGRSIRQPRAPKPNPEVMQLALFAPKYRA